VRLDMFAQVCTLRSLGAFISSPIQFA
jgi:hypothetical protein